MRGTMCHRCVHSYTCESTRSRSHSSAASKWALTGLNRRLFPKAKWQFQAAFAMTLALGI